MAHPAGANQVNMAVFAGSKMRGLPGAVAALFGLCLMPVVLIMVMGFFYFRFKEVPAVKGVLHGASAAAVALTLAMVIQTGRKCLTGLVPVLLFVAAFVLNGVARWPLPLVLLHCRAAQLDLGMAEGTSRMMTTYLQLAGLFARCRCCRSAAATRCCPKCTYRR